MTRVAIYARYSDDKQSAHSIEDQVRICRLHADKADWRVVNTYSDAAISGSTVILRPGVQALLRDALAGEFDVVLAEAMDRLSRDQEDIAGLFKRLRFAGVPIVTLSEGEVSELHVGLKGTMNALFLKDLAAKTHRGNRGRVEAGKVAGGNSYGYKVVREIDAAGKVTTGEREIIPYEADIVRRIFRDYVAGKSPRQICIELNAEGVASPRGRAWGEMTIRGHLSIQSGILNNHFYIGQMVWNRRRDVRNPDTGRARHRVNPQSEWVYAQAPHLRIIDDDLWNAAKARQEHHARAYQAAVAKGAPSFQAAATSRRPATLLSGLITCGLCGGTVAKRGNNRLACVAHIKGQGCTNASAVRSDSLEARVLVGLKERLMAPEVMAEAMRSFIEETNRLNHHRRASETADRLRLEKIKKAIAGIVSAIEDGGYTRPLMERLKSLDAEVETIERTLAEAPRDVPDVHPNVAELYRRKVERLVEALNNPADRTEAATALRALIEKVVVTPTGRRGEVDVRLFGDLETVLAWAEDKDVGFRIPSRLYLKAAGDGLSVPESDRSGDFHRWGARPPSASNGDQAREPLGPRPRRPGRVRKDGAWVRLSVKSAAYRTLAENASRGAIGFVETVHTTHTPDVVRRSATLSIPSAACRVRTRDRAGEHLPHLTASRSVRPHRGRSLRIGALPLWGKTTAQRSVGGKWSPHGPMKQETPMPPSRARRNRPPRLKRSVKCYLKALRRAGFIRAAIAKIAEIRRDHPGEERHAALFFPAWVRQMALDGTEPPTPDIWSFYWRGKGQKNQGRPILPASTAPDTPPNSPHSPRRRHRPGKPDSAHGCP